MFTENLIKIDDLIVETRTLLRGKGVIFYFHGNSSAASSFAPLMNNLHDGGCEFTQIAVSFPGHGKSNMPTDFCDTLSIEELGKFCRKIVDYFRPEQYILVGQSLGGHALLEGLPLFHDADGLILLSSPPINLETLVAAFKPDPSNGLLFKGVVTDEQSLNLASCFFSKKTSPFIKNMARHITATDVRFRERLGESLASGKLLDEISLLANSNIPCMILKAEADEFLYSDYYTSIPMTGATHRSLHVLQGGHALHLEQSDNVAAYIRKFIVDVSVNAIASAKSSYSSLTF